MRFYLLFHARREYFFLGERYSPCSNQSLLPHARIPLAADHHVIVDGDAQAGAGVDHLLGQVDIGK